MDATDDVMKAHLNIWAGKSCSAIGTGSHGDGGRVEDVGYADGCDARAGCGEVSREEDGAAYIPPQAVSRIWDVHKL